MSPQILAEGDDVDVRELNRGDRRTQDFDFTPDFGGAAQARPAASSSRPAAPNASNPLASLLSSMQQNMPSAAGRTITEDTEAFKHYQIIYPIYIDAKRPFKTGERRVPQSHAVAWPHAEEMARGCHALGFRTMLDYKGTHPRDWANPGRVRVLITDNGKPLHPVIRNKRLLLMALGDGLRKTNPLASAPPEQTAYAARYPFNSPAVSQGVLQTMLKPEVLEQTLQMSGMPVPPPVEESPAATKPAIGAPGRRQQKIKMVRR